MDELLMIYFLGCPKAKMVKIGMIAGRTKCDLKKRIKAIQGCSSLKLSLLFVMPGNRSVERLIHEIFQEKRRHHEWFTWDDEINMFTVDMLEAIVGNKPENVKGIAESILWTMEFWVDEKRNEWNQKLSDLETAKATVKVSCI